MQDVSKINNDDFNQVQIEESRYVYVQDLDYETEKKRTIELYKDIINNRKRIEDLDLADMVRIKKLMDDWHNVLNDV